MGFMEFIRQCHTLNMDITASENVRFDACLNQRTNVSHGNRSKIVLCTPDQLEQMEGIVDLLQRGCAVLLNLETDRRDVAQRLLYFIAGVAYHNENQIFRVAASAYLILPYDAEVQTTSYYDRYCS